MQNALTLEHSTNTPFIPVFKEIAKNSTNYKRRNILSNEINNKHKAFNTIYNNSNLIGDYEKNHLEKIKQFKRNYKKKQNFVIGHNKNNKSVQIKPFSKLKEKIDFGSPTFLSLKEKEHCKNLRHFLYQKELLLNSQNFKIGKDAQWETFLSQYQQQHHQNQHQHQSPQIQIQVQQQPKLLTPEVHKTKRKETPISRNKPQCLQIENISTLTIPSIKLDEDNQLNSARTWFLSHQTLSTLNNSSGLNTSRSNNESTSLTYRKLFRQNLNNHIDQLNTRREKDQKKLFKLIDSCSKKFQHKKKKLDKHLKKDMEEILEVKIREKKVHVKKDYLQAVHTKSGLSHGMNSIKAKMINFSETISRFTDEEALKYADHIANDYINYTKEMGLNAIRFENGKQFDFEGIEKRIQNTALLRRKLIDNTKKIYKMRMKIGQENIHMFKQLNDALQKEENINKLEIAKAQSHLQAQQNKTISNLKNSHQTLHSRNISNNINQPTHLLSY